jgi:hypothetical protein
MMYVNMLYYKKKSMNIFLNMIMIFFKTFITLSSADFFFLGKGNMIYKIFIK